MRTNIITHARAFTVSSIAELDNLADGPDPVVLDTLDRRLVESLLMESSEVSNIPFAAALEGDLPKFVVFVGPSITFDELALLVKATLPSGGLSSFMVTRSLPDMVGDSFAYNDKLYPHQHSIVNSLRWSAADPIQGPRKAIMYEVLRGPVDAVFGIPSTEHWVKDHYDNSGKAVYAASPLEALKPASALPRKSLTAKERQARKATRKRIKASRARNR